MHRPVKSRKDGKGMIMKVHITNIYGYIGAEAEAQEAVTAIAKRNLHFDELGIYRYSVEADTPEMLRTRLDGIMSSVSSGDAVVIQSPTWNDFSFDEKLMNLLYDYGRGRIVFIQDVLPLMSQAWEPMMQRYIDFYNKADVVIVASQKMADILKSNGLTVEKIVVHKMFDYVVSVDETVKPTFRKVMHLIGNPDKDAKAEFCRNWNYDAVQLAVTADRGDWAQGKNIRFHGQFNDDNLLANALRKSGGFGLLWSEDSYCREYRKINAPRELSAYLAAGIPVIVPSGIAEQDTIIRKNLGFVVDSLDEAVDRIEHMTEAEYQKMAEDVGLFSNLLRGGFFTKKALTDAVFEVCSCG